VLEQAVHLVNGDLHGEELVEEAEGAGGAAAVARHPGLDVVHLVVDLVDDLVVGLAPVELLEVVRGEDVHGQHLLHQHLDRPGGLDLHFPPTLEKRERESNRMTLRTKFSNPAGFTSESSGYLVPEHERGSRTATRRAAADAAGRSDRVGLDLKV
jgi:hypothetical protein